MSRVAVAVAALVLAAAPLSAQRTAGQELILTDARIWTGDPKNPEASTLLIQNGRIAVVGNVALQARPGIINLSGKRVVPGFYDSHVHLLGGGSRLSEVRLKDAKDEEEFGKRLQEFDKKLPRDQWMLGGNWDHDRALKGELPTAALIDKYVKDRPVFLRRYDEIGRASCRERV